MTMVMVWTCDNCGKEITNYQPSLSVNVNTVGSPNGFVQVDLCEDCWVHNDNKIFKESFDKKRSKPL